MNVLSEIHQPLGAVRIAHSILAYGVDTDELELEVPIPLFLDTLALKIAGVPPDDEFGALSYMLDAKAIDTFQFLLGLDVDLRNRQYFLESTTGYVTDFGSRKLAALELLSKVTPRPRYMRTAEAHFSEAELVLPTLRLLDRDERGWLSTSQLIEGLARLLDPSEQDAQSLSRRPDPHFAKKVRNMISHRGQPSSFIHLGLADYEEGGLRISEQGRATVQALLS